MGSRSIFHEAIDALPEERLDEAAEALGALLEDGFVKTLLTAPYDDEELTPKEKAMLARSEESLKKDGWLSTEAVRRILDQFCEAQSGQPKPSRTSSTSRGRTRARQGASST